ncbi:MAG: AAC(3) family N-acetyltransferase [Dehalococcoidales bacterium]
MEDFNSFDNNFNKIGASFERDFPEKTRIATIGKAVTKLIRQRDIVDYAVAWLSNNTNPLKTSALLS